MPAVKLLKFTFSKHCGTSTHQSTNKIPIIIDSIDTTTTVSVEGRKNRDRSKRRKHRRRRGSPYSEDGDVLFVLVWKFYCGI